MLWAKLAVRVGESEHWRLCVESEQETSEVDFGSQLAAVRVASGKFWISSTFLTALVGDRWFSGSFPRPELRLSRETATEL